MRRRRVAALACAAMMTVGMLAGCGGGDDAGASAGGQSAGAAGAAGGTENAGGAAGGGDGAAANGEVEEIVFATFLSKTVDMKQIEDEINKITEPKIGVRVHIEGISMANYNNQIGLMQSGGEQLDLMGFIGTYSPWLANNQLMCMDDYIDEYGAGIKEVVGEEFLKSTTSAGSLYAVPTYNGKAAVMNIVLRKDLIEELDLPVDQLKLAENLDEYCENLDLIGEMFAKIKETHPELVCLVPTSTAPNSLSFTRVPFVDMLNDSRGVLMPGEDSTVTNLYESEDYARLLQYAYEWNQAGYILEDATTTQEAANTYVQNGRTAGYFIVGEEGQAEQITTATGVEVEAVKLVQPFIATTDVNSLGFAISATSEHPVAAMKFLNEMYTNADIVNLLDWGIEGVHYEVKPDGTVDFPEGVDANTTTYGLNMDWFFGNQFLSYIWGEGRDTSVYERLDANNKNAQCTPVMGFSYDSTKVSTQIASVSNVTSEYLPGLECGAVNPETELPKFIEALNSAGLQEIIAEKQAQLDAWKAENQ